MTINVRYAMSLLYIDSTIASSGLFRVKLRAVVSVDEFNCEELDATAVGAIVIFSAVLVAEFVTWANEMLIENKIKT